MFMVLDCKKEPTNHNPLWFSEKNKQKTFTHFEEWPLYAVHFLYYYISAVIHRNECWIQQLFQQMQQWFILRSQAHERGSQKACWFSAAVELDLEKSSESTPDEHQRELWEIVHTGY